MRRFGLLLARFSRMRSLLVVFAFITAVPLAAQQYILPAAGNAAGSNGTYFRSDVAIWNYREVSQRVLLRWLPQGNSGVGIAPVDITIGAYSGLQDEDFVGEVMHREGVGAIYIVAVRADGSPDPGARLTIQSRIWTPQAGTRGFTSQSFDGIRITQIVGGPQRVITNQRNDFRYRMNVGIVNLDPVDTHTWTVVAPGGGTFTITVPPMAMHQVPVPQWPNSTAAPLLRILGNGGGDTTWLAYGSSVDNVSGDGWTSLAYGATLP
jgi:hypothetical protein